MSSIKLRRARMRRLCSDQHRWVVRGHWRNQPWGPGRELRRPVYILPHIKGPDGAPLIGGERVTTVTAPQPRTTPASEGPAC